MVVVITNLPARNTLFVPGSQNASAVILGPGMLATDGYSTPLGKKSVNKIGTKLRTKTHVCSL